MAAYSCEPKRYSAFSQDLRWQMVYVRESLGLTYEERTLLPYGRDLPEHWHGGQEDVQCRQLTI